MIESIRAALAELTTRTVREGGEYAMLDLSPDSKFVKVLGGETVVIRYYVDEILRTADFCRDYGVWGAVLIGTEIYVLARLPIMGQLPTYGGGTANVRDAINPRKGDVRPHRSCRGSLK